MKSVTELRRAHQNNYGVTFNLIVQTDMQDHLEFLAGQSVE
jgi:hypothetical protein